MADGTPMQPQGNNAASKTLPLGTTAMVTNIQTGRTAIVTIRDRGPYVKGRIVDLSPSTAHKIGLEPKQGVTKVEVAPLEVPLPGGGMKAGRSLSRSEESLERTRRPHRRVPAPGRRLGKSRHIGVAGIEPQLAEATGKLDDQFRAQRVAAGGVGCQQRAIPR